MSHPNLGRALIFAAALGMTAGLAACGKTGELQRPGTLASGPGQRGPASRDASRPVSTIDPRDEINNPAPSRYIPTPGVGSDPTAPGPQGSLPDPYVNPR
jgi:hypothetical protein